MQKNLVLRDRLNALKSDLPGKILQDHFQLRPDMAITYSEHQKLNFSKDVAWILSFLGESVWAGKPALFEEFASWLRNFLSSLHVPMKDVVESFQLIKKRLGESLTPTEYFFFC